MEIFSVYLNFLTILTLLTAITGLVVLIDRVFFKKKRGLTNSEASEPFFVDQSRQFFPIFLFVLVLRGFLYEGYRIPSGSLEPTLLVGDIILVNKYTYGLRTPIGNKPFFKVSTPKRGDIVVFEWPPNRNIYMIKRVIGVPGDKIEYTNGIIYINGKEAKQDFIKHQLEGTKKHTVELRQENLDGVSHGIFYQSDKKSFNLNSNGDYSVIVPEGHYFMMGDNRSFSADSRSWGFMPYDKIVGKAVAIVVSFDNYFFGLRLNRTFSKIV